MYCRQCGKFIGTDAEFCDECKQKQEQTATQEQTTAQEQTQATDNTQYQFTDPYASSYQQANPSRPQVSVALGKGIASIILSFVGFIFTYIGLILLNLTMGEGFMCLLLGFVPLIIGFIFGIKAIVNFKQTSQVKNALGKRIPMLILGINAVALSGIMFFIMFIIMFITLITLGAVFGV